MKKEAVASSGGAFVSMLTVLFIGLKLTSHIDWSWWWVLSPLWLPVTVFLGILIVALIVLALFEIFVGGKRK